MNIVKIIFFLIVNCLFNCLIFGGSLWRANSLSPPPINPAMLLGIFRYTLIIVITWAYVLQLLQLPDSKLVKSRGSWPGPGLNSMRTLESVCPEISRSEQYLSPPVHDREYGLAKKQSCSSETSNGICGYSVTNDYFSYNYLPLIWLQTAKTNRSSTTDSHQI